MFCYNTGRLLILPPLDLSFSIRTWVNRSPWFFVPLAGQVDVDFMAGRYCHSINIDEAQSTDLSQ